VKAGVSVPRNPNGDDAFSKANESLRPRNTQQGLRSLGVMFLPAITTQGWAVRVPAGRNHEDSLGESDLRAVPRPSNDIHGEPSAGLRAANRNLCGLGCDRRWRLCLVSSPAEEFRGNCLKRTIKGTISQRTFRSQGKPCRSSFIHPNLWKPARQLLLRWPQAPAWHQYLSTHGILCP
jgi:hypothetical protein